MSDVDNWWEEGVLSHEELADRVYLEHFGVKGMHWGVRREHAKVKAASTDRKKVDKTIDKQKVKGTKALTNKELGDLNKRLQLEKTLKQLQTPQNKLTIKKGHEHVKEALAIGGTLAAVASFASSDKGIAIRKALEGKAIDLIMPRSPGTHFAP